MANRPPVLRVAILLPRTTSAYLLSHLRVMLPYLVFLITGLAYYVLLSAVAAGGPGLHWGTAWPIVVALVLGGFAPGLTLLHARSGFILAVSMAVLLVGHVVLLVVGDPNDAFALVATVPALIVIGQSVTWLWRGKDDDIKPPRNVWLLLPAVAPMLAAGWLVMEIVVRLIR